MEEDIEILEDNKDMFIDTLYECYRQSAVKPFEKAIENLINRIKELEEEVERRIEKEALDYRYVDKNMLRKDIIQRDYIPKSKIKEKIEELKKNKDFDEDVYVEEFAVDILKELLE